MIIITDSQRNSMQIGEDVNTLVRLFYGAEGSRDYIALSSNPLPDTWAENEYRPMLTNAPSQSSGSEFKTNKMETGNINLIVSNGLILGSRLSDLVYDATLGTGADVGMENRDYEIRLFTEGVTTWAGSIPFSKGKIRDITHTDKQVTFKLQDQTQINNNILTPLNLITADDAVAGTVPDSSLNVPKPDIYGDLRSHINFYSDLSGRILADTDWDPARTFRATEMIPIGEPYWFVADHVVKAPDSDEGDAIWAWDPALDRTVEAGFSVFQNTSAGTIIARSGSQYVDYRLAIGIDVVDPGDWTDPENAVDNDVATDASAQILAGDGQGTKKVLELAFPPNDIASVDSVTLAVTYSRASLATGVYELYGWEDDTFQLTASGSDGRFYLTVTKPTPSDGDLALVALWYEKVTGAATQGDIVASAVFLRVVYTNTDNLQLFYGGRGRTDDGLSSGNVIEDAADVMKSVAEDILTITDIDTAAFTAAAAANDVDFAFGLTASQVKAGEVFASMGIQSRSLVWWKTDGTLTTKVIDRTYTSSDAIVDYTEAKKPPKHFLTSLNDLVTQSTVLYANYRDGFTGTTAEINDTTARTKHSVTAAQSVDRLEADKIGASASAVNYNTANLRQFENRHIGIEFEGGKKYMPLDIGDVVEFENVPYKIFGLDITQNNSDAATSSRTIYKYFMIHKILSRSAEGIIFQCFQLHDLSA